MRAKLLILMIISSSRVCAEGDFRPSEQELIDECPLCTPAERDLRALMETKAMAEALGQLMQIVEKLAGEPEALEALLLDIDNAVPERILKAARAMHDKKQSISPGRQDQVVALASTTQRASTSNAQIAGSDGLVPGFAEAGNVALGIKPSAVMVSHGRPIPLKIGESFLHNEGRYELAQVVVRTDELGDVWHDVVLLGPNNGKLRLELR